MYKEIKGDLFRETGAGSFDVIGHQTNCFHVQGGGISGQFVKHFKTNDCSLYPLENARYIGNINSLGQINICRHRLLVVDDYLDVINIYSQYHPGPNTDYIALQLCLRKINHIYKGKRIGLPQISCGIGGGNWKKVRKIIKEELIDCDVTVVIYNKK